jgi:hypothetical protein
VTTAITAADSVPHGCRVEHLGGALGD